MILQRIQAAMSGRQYWLALKQKYEIDNGLYVLLMPETDDELNNCTLRHIDGMISYRNARGVIILSNQDRMLEKAKAISTNIVEAIQVNEKEIDNLLSFYELYQFSERLIIVSLTRPYGNKAHMARGINKVNLDDVVCLGLLLTQNYAVQY